MGDYQWQNFTRKSRPVTKNEPKVSIHKGGSIGLNEAATAAIGYPEMVSFRHSAQPRAIAIRAAGQGDQNAYILQKQDSNSRIVHAKAFLDWVGIKLGKLQVYTPKVVDGMLVIDLNGQDNGDRNGTAAG